MADCTNFLMSRSAPISGLVTQQLSVRNTIGLVQSLVAMAA